MQVIKQIWDSDFFGYCVGRIEITDETQLDNLRNAEIEPFRLVYVFSNMPIDSTYFTRYSMKLYDVKVLLGKTVDNAITCFNNLRKLSKISADLTRLTLQSGEYSRFKLDPEFQGYEFERMYSAWISKALIQENGLVLGNFDEEKLNGFITLTTENNAVNIGLIAVDENHRGKKIGRKLLEAAVNFAIERNLFQINVSTQKANEVAMNFYLNNGYKILQETNIYHLWK